VLAVGEVLARRYRHPSYVHQAVTAGASWAQIAEALVCSEDRARDDYRAWAEGQQQLWLYYDGKFGMDPTDYERALRRCSE
jgi:hypothetical protein